MVTFPFSKPEDLSSCEQADNGAQAVAPGLSVGKGRGLSEQLIVSFR